MVIFGGLQNPFFSDQKFQVNHPHQFTGELLPFVGTFQMPSPNSGMAWAILFVGKKSQVELGSGHQALNRDCSHFLLGR